MSASNSGKKVVSPMVASDELHTPLTAAILPLLFPIPQSKKVQMDNAGGNNSDNSNVTVTITPI